MCHQKDEDVSMAGRVSVSACRQWSINRVSTSSCFALKSLRSFVWSDLIWFGLKLGGHGMDKGDVVPLRSVPSVSANAVGTGISSCFNISFRSTFLPASHAAVA